MYDREKKYVLVDCRWGMWMSRDILHFQNTKHTKPEKGVSQPIFWLVDYIHPCGFLAGQLLRFAGELWNWKNMFDFSAQQHKSARNSHRIKNRGVASTTDWTMVEVETKKAQQRFWVLKFFFNAGHAIECLQKADWINLKTKGHSPWSSSESDPDLSL